MSFSANNRSHTLSQLSQQKIDLLIIGGGITGAGIALDAALRGWKVAVIEKKDFSSGTSSRSTKLIHGGLRYLKQFELKLVHETGTERAVIHHNAPHLVKPEDMLLPIVEGGTLGKVGTSIALWVYDKLAGVKDEEAFETLSKEETLKAEPLLSETGLKGGALYTEYRTDDARLTLEVLKSAIQKGANAVNYAEVTDLLYHNDKSIRGVVVQDSIQGKTYEIEADVIVNAAGPWVDFLRQKDHSLMGKRLHITKGVHIVVEYNRLPLAQSMYFDVKDGRMIFAVPRMDKVYIGTTDTNYSGDLHEPDVTKADIDYLLNAANHMFPSAQLQASDIESTWSGVRPLIHEDGKSPSELSRKDEIFISESGLISIAGGKLTGFRKMAERITNLVGEKLSEKGCITQIPACATENHVLTGGDFPSEGEISPFIKQMYQKYGKLEPSMKHISYLVHSYGTQTDEILQNALLYLEQGLEKPTAILKGELMFTLEKECVANISDFLVRRTGKLYFNRSSIPEILPTVTEICAAYLGWDEAEKNKQVAAFQQLFTQAVTWK